ncbi:MAG: glycosyltransferase family 2 protein [Terriglobia bacterium]
MLGVSVSLVTYNSEAYLERCLASLFAQQGAGLEVIVVDNASRDGTLGILERHAARLHLICNRENRGFAAAQNQAVRQASREWLFCLNPDVVLSPTFLQRLLEAAEPRAQVGMACGKLLRLATNGAPATPALFDSAGIYFTPTLRHFDRGSNQPDRGQYQRREYVFGATGAAALYRRALAENVTVEGEFFDEDFFAYREDADLAWRAQLAGWRCLYVPEAVGWHARRVLPEKRRAVAARLNYHSVKNRFLMRAKNISWPLYWRVFVPMKLRDLGIVAYALVRERSSLPAFAYLWRQRRRIREKRRRVQALRRVPDAELARWFRFRPVSFPVESAP